MEVIGRDIQTSAEQRSVKADIGLISLFPCKVRIGAARAICSWSKSVASVNGITGLVHIHLILGIESVVGYDVVAVHAIGSAYLEIGEPASCGLHKMLLRDAPAGREGVERRDDASRRSVTDARYLLSQV